MISPPVFAFVFEFVAPASRRLSDYAVDFAVVVALS
jgi:hypothetical protein